MNFSPDTGVVPPKWGGLRWILLELFSRSCALWGWSVSPLEIQIIRGILASFASTIGIKHTLVKCSKQNVFFFFKWREKGAHVSLVLPSSCNHMDLPGWTFFSFFFSILAHHSGCQSCSAADVRRCTYRWKNVNCKSERQEGTHGDQWGQIVAGQSNSPSVKMAKDF